jgi:hypothetical protein
MKKIGIFTYTIPHRKTIDIFARLLVAGFDREDIFFIAFPYTSKKRNPLYEHRPQNLYDCRYQIDYFMERNEPIPNCDIYLIGGAGIIPSHIIEGRKIINSHPGYLPNVRGLDALKWAIDASLYTFVEDIRGGDGTDDEILESILNHVIEMGFLKTYENIVKNRESMSKVNETDFANIRKLGNEIDFVTNQLLNIKDKYCKGKK